MNVKIPSLALAFLVAVTAVQIPHTAFANNGGGKTEDISNLGITPNAQRRLARRTLSASEATNRKTTRTEKSNSKGLFGIFGRKK